MTTAQPRAQGRSGHHVGLVLATAAFSQYLTGRAPWLEDEAPHLLGQLTGEQLALTVTAADALAAAARAVLRERTAPP
jgi:hypothetical protein